MSDVTTDKPKLHSSRVDRDDIDGGLDTMSVRDLLAALAHVEAELRRTPFLTTRNGSTAINPDVAPLLSRQRQLVYRLQEHRTSQSRGEADRRRSAAWPPPPWS
ncbi:hypothetical protein [Pedococcus sp. 5OH_020]|uniref:hypothetical protein n=1 Tax=Pedococcus sp. 5OH_020 TaxID=2989814 RepID=UPI0022E9A0BC|nr:hypothetical protein [Pedococcus sp. 5OH_020]